MGIGIGVNRVYIKAICQNITEGLMKLDETAINPEIINFTRAKTIVEKFLESHNFFPIIDDPVLKINQSSMTDRHYSVRYVWSPSPSIILFVSFIMVNEDLNFFFIFDLPFDWFPMISLSSAEVALFLSPSPSDASSRKAKCAEWSKSLKKFLLQVQKAVSKKDSLAIKNKQSAD